MGIFNLGSKDQKPLVLVVDDDPVLAEMLCDFLSLIDCETINTPNGNEALKIARDKQPDLILLDIVMPSMDGLTILKLLKRDPASVNIPVIMVTGEQKGKDVELAFTLGAVDYIIKPIRQDQFDAKIKAVLSQKGKG